MEAPDGGELKNAQAALVTEAIDDSAANLPWKPWFADQMSVGTAKFAVYAFCDQNLVCHSESKVSSERLLEIGIA